MPVSMEFFVNCSTADVGLLLVDATILTDKDVYKVVLNKTDFDATIIKKFSNGFAIWLQVRYTLYKELLNNKVEEKEKKTKSVKERLFSLCKAIKYYIIVFSRSPLNNNVNYDYLTFNSSISCFKNIDGVSISKIHHFFISESSLRFLNIFQSVRGKYFSKYSEPYAYHEAVYLKSAIQAKFSNRTHPDDSKTILQFINFLKDEVGEYIPGQFYSELQNELLKKEPGGLNLQCRILKNKETVFVPLFGEQNKHQRLGLRK